MQTVMMPAGADILHVDDQHGSLNLWAMIEDLEESMIDREIIIAGTGHGIVDDGAGLKFIGTALALEGALVWHVFERKNGAVA